MPLPSPAVNIAPRVQTSMRFVAKAAESAGNAIINMAHAAEQYIGMPNTDATRYTLQQTIRTVWQTELATGASAWNAPTWDLPATGTITGGTITGAGTTTPFTQHFHVHSYHWDVATDGTATNTVNIVANGAIPDGQVWVYPGNGAWYHQSTGGTLNSGAATASVYIDEFGNIVVKADAWMTEAERKRDELRRKIRECMCPEPKRSDGTLVRAVSYGRPDFSSVTPQEATALNLLKTMLPPNEWRRYLKYGFVMVHGKSGLDYKIARDGHHIHVVSRGRKVAELCIHLNGSVPPTDHVIGKKILLECSEHEVWLKANISGRQELIGRKPQEADLAKMAA